MCFEILVGSHLRRHVLHRSPSTPTAQCKTCDHPRGTEISDDRQKMTLYSKQGLNMTEVDASHVIEKHGAIEIVGSCNGLVCLLSVYPGVLQIPNSLLLWKLPNAPTYDTRSFGFGFDAASGDYKVVYLARYKNSLILYAQVLVKSGTVWREAKGKQYVWGRPEMLPSTGTVEAMAKGRRLK